jgi:hypothetical protein
MVMMTLKTPSENAAGRSGVVFLFDMAPPPRAVDSFKNAHPVLKKCCFSGFKDDACNFVGRSEQRSVIDCERPHCRPHAFGHEVLCFGIDHSILLRHEIPCRL